MATGRDLSAEQKRALAPIALRVLNAKFKGSKRDMGEALGYSGHSAGSPVTRLLSGQGIAFDRARRILDMAGEPASVIGLTSESAAGRALADHETWPAARAKATGFDEATLDAAGATIPPRPLRAVTPTVVRAYALAWAEAASLALPEERAPETGAEEAPPKFKKRSTRGGPAPKRATPAQDGAGLPAGGRSLDVEVAKSRGDE